MVKPVGVLFSLLLSLLPGQLHSQGTVTVHVRDSSSAAVRLHNARIWVSPGGFVASIDSLGQARFPRTRNGVDEISLYHPLFEIVGAASATMTIPGGDADTLVTVVIPSVKELQSRICGASADIGQTIVAGFVFGENGSPAPGVLVGALWQEAVLTDRALGRELRATIDTTDEVGRYVLCGTPRSAPFLLRAGTDELGSEPVEISFASDAWMRQDLHVGGVRRSAYLRGTIVSDSGRPIVGAIVGLASSPDLNARTDSAGNFRLTGLPVRTFQLQVRSIGFDPVRPIVTGSAGGLSLDTIALVHSPQLLETVSVIGRGPTTARELEFQERRRKGRGTFLDAATLARLPNLSSRVLVATTTGLRRSSGRSGRLQMARSAYTSTPCFPDFYLDGVRYGHVYDALDEEALLKRAVRLEIYKADEIPLEYFGTSTCGVVLVWTA